jgi:NodT family efflux transporter outer membrane factor (OMF) lipoprotein
VRANRERFEHAIAVLTGKAPGDFALAPAPWSDRVPAIPLGVPSALLQRRPDIASAERQVAAANAQIGVQKSAYFPNLTLSASIGSAGLTFGDLFSAATPLWSFGVALAQTVFDAGAIGARVDQARAAHELAVARYRQTVLAAFQGVEDQLTNARSQAEQAGFLKQASDAADQVEQQILNRYRAGQLGYTDVVAAQASALSARRALVQVAVNRQVSAINLIQALGGGWDVAAPVELKSSLRSDSAP